MLFRCRRLCMAHLLRFLICMRPSTLTEVTQGKKGTVSISGGAVTYTSTNPTDTGMDTFTYTISDGYGCTATGTVTVTLATLRRW